MRSLWLNCAWSATSDLICEIKNHLLHSKIWKSAIEDLSPPSPRMYGGFLFCCQKHSPLAAWQCSKSEIMQTMILFDHFSAVTYIRKKGKKDTVYQVTTVTKMNLMLWNYMTLYGYVSKISTITKKNNTITWTQYAF